MKMTKKVLLATVVAAAVLVTACKEVIGDVEWKSHNNGNQTVTYLVNQKNDNDTIIRGAKKIQALQRAGGTCVITLNDQTSSSHDGVTGFIFGLEKNANGTLDFLSVGVQNYSGTLRYYVSMFYNIDPNNLSADNFGTHATATTKESRTDPYEIIVKDWTNITDGFTKCKADTNTLKYAIDINTVKNSTTVGGVTGSKGSYVYKIYKTGDINISDGDFAAGVFDFGSATPIAEGIVTTDQNGRTEDDVKGSVYTYANIQPHKTLNARWDVYNITSKANANIRAAADLEEDFSCGEVIFE